MSPVIALRKAVRAALAGDATLLALLGGAKVFEEAPRGAPPPWITFGETASRDWSTSSDRGCDQRLALHVWSGAGGLEECLVIAERVATLLDEAQLTLEGHRLARLTIVAQEAGRDARGRFSRASLRLRALTERI